MLLYPFLLFLLSNFWQVHVKVTKIQTLFSKDQIYVHFFCPNMLRILLTFTCQIILTFQDTCPPYFILTLLPFSKAHPPNQISMKVCGICTSEKKVGLLQMEVIRKMQLRSFLSRSTPYCTWMYVPYDPENFTAKKNIFSLR